MNQNANFKEWLQPLEVGSIVYSFKPYREEPVSMEVLNIDHDALSVELKSVSVHGYHYWITEETFNHIQKRGPRSQHYYPEQSAVDALDKYDSDRKEKFVNYYKNNPENFIKEMVRKAYESESDAEYGDYVIAKAIEDVAKHMNIDIGY